MSVEIDTSLLPKKCLIDTNIIIRSLGEFSDERSAACHAFFRAMFRADGCRMYIAAPTLAEVLRGNASAKIPSTPSIVHVPFDRRAAEVMARELPFNVLRLERKEQSVPLTYLKYDAMICACAKVAQVDCIVALDTDFWKLAPRVNIPVRSPEDFQPKQQPLRLSGETESSE